MKDTAASITDHRYLVYTSAGESSNVYQWVRGAREFDLWVTYYGDKTTGLRRVADYYNRRKGGKFSNLHFVYCNYRKILNKYEAILVMDDDIIIRTFDINRLFTIRNQYDLWVLQPAFDPVGKVSHLITCVNPLTELRFTNFVELGCPLFRRDKLDKFMDIYDPTLVGWGVDLWFMHSLGSELNGKVAVVDSVTCVNPDDANERKIDQLQSAERRRETWEKIRIRYSVPQQQRFIEYSAIGRQWNSRVFSKYLVTRLRFYGQKVKRWSRRKYSAAVRGVRGYFAKK